MPTARAAAHPAALRRSRDAAADIDDDALARDGVARRGRARRVARRAIIYRRREVRLVMPFAGQYAIRISNDIDFVAYSAI